MFMAATKSVASSFGNSVEDSLWGDWSGQASAVPLRSPAVDGRVPASGVLIAPAIVQRSHSPLCSEQAALLCRARLVAACPCREMRSPLTGRVVVRSAQCSASLSLLSLPLIEPVPWRCPCVFAMQKNGCWQCVAPSAPHVWESGRPTHGTQPCVLWPLPVHGDTVPRCPAEENVPDAGACEQRNAAPSAAHLLIL